MGDPFMHERNNPKAISPSASLASLVSFKSLWREAMPRHVVTHSVCRRTLLRAIPRAGSVPGQLQAGCRKPGLAGSGKSEAQAAGKPPDLKPKNNWKRKLFYRLTPALIGGSIMNNVIILGPLQNLKTE